MEIKSEPFHRHRIYGIEKCQEARTFHACFYPSAQLGYFSALSREFPPRFSLCSVLFSALIKMDLPICKVSPTLRPSTAWMAAGDPRPTRQTVHEATWNFKVRRNPNMVWNFLPRALLPDILRGWVGPSADAAAWHKIGCSSNISWLAYPTS